MGDSPKEFLANLDSSSFDLAVQILNLASKVDHILGGLSETAEEMLVFISLLVVVFLAAKEFKHLFPDSYGGGTDSRCGHSMNKLTRSLQPRYSIPSRNFDSSLQTDASIFGIEVEYRCDPSQEYKFLGYERVAIWRGKLSVKFFLSLVMTGKGC